MSSISDEAIDESLTSVLATQFCDANRQCLIAESVVNENLETDTDPN